MVSIQAHTIRRATPQRTACYRVFRGQAPALGFAQTFWKDAMYGALTFMGQYSYLSRDPWSIARGQPRMRI
jgi:hypothetical protein